MRNKVKIVHCSKSKNISPVLIICYYSSLANPNNAPTFREPLTEKGLVNGTNLYGIIKRCFVNKIRVKANFLRVERNMNRHSHN